MTNSIVVANMARATKIFRRGAKVYLLAVMGDPDRVKISGHSRGGRIIEKWENIRNLSNARTVTMPPIQSIQNSFWGYHGRICDHVVDLINCYYKGLAGKYVWR